MCFVVLIINLEGGVSSKSRYRSRDVVGSNERHDGNHGKTSIVKLTAPLRLKNSRINIGEIEFGENNLRKRTSLGVVGILGLGGKLSNEDSSNDLSLSSKRDKLPSIEGVHCGKRFEGNIRGEHTREVESRGLYEVSSGGEHGNTGVLELGSTEPAEGTLRSEL